MLTRHGCLGRQERFRSRLRGSRIDAAVIADPRDVYYFTGALPTSFPTLLYLGANGGSWLISHTDDGEAAVDERRLYEYQKLFTMNPDPVACLNKVVHDHLRGLGHIAVLGWQEEALPRAIAQTLEEAFHPDSWVVIDGELAAQQEVKDSDEVVVLRQAIACSIAAYAAAAKAIRPGAHELEVLEAAHRAATLEAGEPIYHGGDYRCAEFGGPARNRVLQEGELYTIDAQTTYQGYWSDLSRAFSVSEPTDLQASVYEHIAGILREVPGQVKPGGSGSALWHWIDGKIRELPHLREHGLIHHGGHGVGTRCHEAPDINRDRDGTFAVGNVFSCEPGAYSPALRTGIRLENTFLITGSGVENLSDFPLDLKAALSSKR